MAQVQKWPHIAPDVKHISAAPEHRSAKVASREEQLLQANRQLRKELQVDPATTPSACASEILQTHVGDLQIAVFTLWILHGSHEMLSAIPV